LARTRPKAPEPPEPPPPLILEVTPQFERDARRQEKRGKPMEKLRAVVDALQTHRPLPPSHKDHALKGDWKGYRECHVGGEGDWLLVYIRGAGRLKLFRTGKHEEIF
jgi:mRNA interferase YafQ